MTSQVYTIREYGRIICSKTPGKSLGNEVHLDEESFKRLKTLLLREDEKQPQLENFVKVGMSDGREMLQVQNYCGVLRTGCGLQVEILPKILGSSGDDDRQVKETRSIFLKMLRTLHDAPFKKVHEAELKKESTMLEFFLGLFLQEINQLVKKGLRSDYVQVQRNEFFLKGKLLASRNLQHNFINRHKFFTEYDEYQINSVENRLLKSALLKVSRILKRTANQRLCRELLFVFDEVKPSVHHRKNFQQVRKDRSMKHYEESLRWCRMILEDQAPTAQAGQQRSLSILFPMEKLFESYVAVHLRRQRPSWQISEQFTGMHLVDSHGGRPLFQLKPDYFAIKENGEQLILDAKWKVLDDRKDKSGLSQADFYQLYAYGKKYLRDEKQKKVFLIYPRTERLENELQPFFFEEGDNKSFELRVLLLDLKEDVFIGDLEL